MLALTLATITAIVFHRRRHPLRTDEAFQGEPRETLSASPSGNSRGGHDELVQARIEAWDKARREREQLRDQLSALEREAARARELQPALTDELLLAERRAEQARVRAEEEAGALVRRAEAEGGRFLRVAQAKRDELREETLRLRAIERELRSNYLDLIEAAAVLLGDVPDRHTGEGEADEALPPCSPARTSRAAGSPASGS